MIEFGQKLMIAISFFILGFAAFNIMYFYRANIRRALTVRSEVKTPERPEEKIDVEFHAMILNGAYPHNNGVVKVVKVERTSGK